MVAHSVGLVGEYRSFLELQKKYNRRDGHDITVAHHHQADVIYIYINEKFVLFNEVEFIFIS